MRSLLSSVFRHPVTTLLAANASSVVLGLASLAVMLSYFGSREFAVVGVLLAIGSLISMALDLRLLDLVSLRFFDQPEDQPAARLAVLRAALVTIAIQGGLIALLTIVIAKAFSRYFLETEVADYWIVCTGVFAGCQMSVSGLSTTLRLNGDFSATAALRVANQANSSFWIIALLVLAGSLQAYFTAIALAGVVSVALSFITADRIARKQIGGSLMAMPPSGEFASLAAQRKFLVSGAYFSLGWMTARAGDVLVLAALTSDAVTGTYRVAKQCADAGQGLMDAIPLFYEPTIVAALKRGDLSEFRKHRRRIVAIGTVAALCAVAGILLVIGPLAETVYPQHLASIVPLAILATSMATRSGVHPWLWPMLIVNDQARRFSLLLIAGSVVQFSLLALLAWFNALDARSAAMTLWANMIVVYAPYLLTRRPTPP